MAPSSTEPRQLLVVLNPARRKALYQLVSEITAYMRSQLQLANDTNVPEDEDWPALHDTSDGRQSELATDDPSAIPTVSGRARADVLVSQIHTHPSAELVALRKLALAHFDEWRKDCLAKLKELLSKADTKDIVELRQKRNEKMERMKADGPAEGEDLLDFGEGPSTTSTTPLVTKKAVQDLQAIYHPIPTSLITIPLEDRKEVLSAVLILLLSTGAYSAHTRAFITYLTSAFELPLSALTSEEMEIARTMIEASTEAEKSTQNGEMSADAEAQKRTQQNQASRFWKVGLASVAGAALIGVTGGLAAPIVAGAVGGLMGSVGLGGLASFLGVFWMNGALVGTLFGAFGARMTVSSPVPRLVVRAPMLTCHSQGEMMNKYAKEVQDFRFLPLKDEGGADFSKADKDVRRLRVTVGINGWLMSEDEVTKPWRVLGDDTETFALRYEMDSLLKLGTALEGMVSSYAWSVLKIEILRRTVLATLWAALWPIQIVKLAAGVDNPFNLAKNRSEKAGRILADALINKVQGERPVTLVGYSLGARVIYFCLKTLAERKAFGLVDTVVFIGAPVPANRQHWQTMRSVVAGKLFNVYSESDWILAFLYRATSIQLGIAGLQAVADIKGVENLDLTQEVKGHLRYSRLIAQILTRCGFDGIRGGESPIEKEDDIKLENTDGPMGKEGTLVDVGDQPEAVLVTPVRVKPLGKKGHRDVSFSSGINHRGDERPVMRKVQSVPITGGLAGGLRSVSPDRESEEEGEESRRIERVIRDESPVINR